MLAVNIMRIGWLSYVGICITRSVHVLGRNGSPHAWFEAARRVYTREWHADTLESRRAYDPFFVAPSSRPDGRHLGSRWRGAGWRPVRHRARNNGARRGIVARHDLSPDQTV